MRKAIHSKQHDITDCGAACISSVSAFYGLKIPVSKIRQYAGTDQKGTNLAGMMEASEKLGLMAKAFRVKKESLENVPLPAIAHLSLKENWHHFVVIYRCGRRNISIMDPSTGKVIKLSRAKFGEQWTGVLLVIAPSENFEKGNQITSIWQRFFRLVKPHRSIIAEACAGAVFYSILGLSTSVYVEKLIDYVIPGGNTRLLNLMSLGLLLILVFRTLIGFLKTVFMLRTGQKIDAMLIMGYFRHLMKLPQHFFETMRTGEIISRVNDAVKIRAFINNVAADILVNLLIIVFTFILMVLYSGEMAVRMALIIPLFLVIYLIYNKLNKKYLRLAMEQTAEVESQLVESMNAMATIKRFNNGWKENMKFEHSLIPLLKSAFTANKISLSASSLNEFLSGFFLLTLLWSGTFLVFRQKMTPGELISCYALFGYMLGPLNSLIQSNRHIQDAMIAADRLFQIIDLDRENENEDKAILKTEDISSIRFDAVSFRYGPGRNLFTGLDLHFEMNKINGITGDTGTGKSTILSLLQGIYLPAGGRIMFGDLDLAYIKKSSLSVLIGCVPQKTDIFSGSIAENIALSDIQPDMSKLIKVCNETGIMEMIENLPSGLLTFLGESGIKLSGGELQKISIARAVYRDPEIFLFDEPTASMDKTSEDKLKSLLSGLKGKGKTIILVSHRDSTLEICDNLQYIKNGMALYQSPFEKLKLN